MFAKCHYVLVNPNIHTLLFFQAMEVEENLIKTKEELQSVMSPTNSAPTAGSSSSSSDSDSDHEHSEENSTYSAELQTQGIDHRKEEERLTEAEKNERLKRQLMVSFSTGKEG